MKKNSWLSEAVIEMTEEEYMELLLELYGEDWERVLQYQQELEEERAADHEFI